MGQSIKVMAKMLRVFVSDNEIGTLNVAGPRTSKEPGIGDFVQEVLEAPPR
jgi:Circularly permutated YpsA SLOG family